MNDNTNEDLEGSSKQFLFITTFCFMAANSKRYGYPLSSNRNKK